MKRFCSKPRRLLLDNGDCYPRMESHCRRLGGRNVGARLRQPRCCDVIVVGGDGPGTLTAEIRGIAWARMGGDHVTACCAKQSLGSFCIFTCKWRSRFVLESRPGVAVATPCVDFWLAPVMDPRKRGPSLSKTERTDVFLSSRLLLLLLTSVDAKSCSVSFLTCEDWICNKKVIYCKEEPRRFSFVKRFIWYEANLFLTTYSPLAYLGWFLSLSLWPRRQDLWAGFLRSGNVWEKISSFSSMENNFPDLIFWHTFLSYFIQDWCNFT